jgi:hypothetical protein
MQATLSRSCLCATSAASVKPSLPGCWPPCPGVASAPCLRGLSQTLFTWRLATLSWSCLCATSAAYVKPSLPGGWPPCPGAASAPPLQPQSNPLYLEVGHLVLELPLRNLCGLSQTLFTWRLATLLELPLRHLRGLRQTLFTWRLATLSWSCLCANSAASVKPSLPGGWPPCPGVASASPPQPQSNPLYLEACHLVLELPLRHLCGLSQTLFTWMLATLSWSCLCATSAPSVKPSLPGGWPPCPGVASAPPPHLQSNPLYLDAGYLVLELPLRHLGSLSQTLFTWMLAPCPGVASASPQQPLSNPLYLEAGHLVLELPLRHLQILS